MKSETKDTSDDRNNNEDKVKSETGVQVAAEGRLKAAENKLEEVQKFIENKKNEISAEVMIQIQAQLKIAKDLIVEGKAKLVAKEYGLAFNLFGQSKSKAQETKMLVEAKTNLEEKDDKDGNENENEGTSQERTENNGGSGKIKINIGL